jgi:hypothetical protein
MSDSVLGPQRGPASVPQIEAQAKQTNREIEAMSDAKERPDEVGLELPDAFGAWFDGTGKPWLIAVFKSLNGEQTRGGYELHPEGWGTEFRFEQQLPRGGWSRAVTAAHCPACQNWSQQYAKQADELVAVKSRLDEAELSARHWGGVAFKNAEYADVFRARLADAEKRAEAAEQRAEAAEAKRATTRATADGSFRAQFITKDQANERD